MVRHARLGCVLHFLLTVAVIAPARAQLPIAPSGFTVSLVADSLPVVNGIAVAPASFGAHAGDVFLAASDTSQVLRVTPAGAKSVFAAGVATSPVELAFAPGGSFGTDLYVSCNSDPAASDFGAVWRLSSAGALSAFGTQTPPTPPNFKFGAGGFAFSPGGVFGNSMYTGTSGGNAGDCLSRMGPAGGQAELFTVLTGAGGGISNGFPGGLQFGTGLAGFGAGLYFAYWRTEGLPGLAAGIYRIQSDGTRTPFANVLRPAEIEFGPGGAFGQNLYVAQTDDGSGTGTILRIDSAGTTTVFVSGIIGTAFGLAFADSSALYFNSASPGRLYRLTPMPTVSVPEPAAGPALRLTAGPNPFAGALSIAWSARQAEPSELCVYSIDGRCVRRILDEVRGPGLQRATWDGRDEAGRASRAGIYVVSLRSGSRRSKCRVGLLR